MFEKLKQCKTIKEIYQTLGRDFFEKVASVILVMWCALPIVSILNHALWMSKSDMWFQYKANIESGYQLTVMIMGIITIEFVLVYTIGLALLRETSMKTGIINNIKQEPWNFIFIILLIWSGICTLLSEDKSTSFFGTSYRDEGFATYCYYASVYACAHILKNENKRRRVFNTYAIVSVILGVCLLLQDRAVLGMDELFIFPRATVFSQFNHMGYYLNISVLVMTGLFLSTEKIKYKVVYLLGMAFQLYCLLVNNTFGAYLGAMCGVVIVSIFYVIKTRNVKMIIAPIVIFIFVSGISIGGKIKSSSGEDLSNNFKVLAHDTQSIATDADDADRAGTGRMGMWKAGLKMVPESPVFGYGPDMINKKYFQKYINFTERVENEYLQYAIFLGIPGLVLYLATLITMVVCQLKEIKKISLTTIAAAGCVAGYLVGAFAGNSMYYTAPYLYLFLGMASKKTANDKNPPLSV